MEYNVTLRHLARVWIPGPLNRTRVVGALVDAFGNGDLTLGTSAEVVLPTGAFANRVVLADATGWVITIGDSLDISLQGRLAPLQMTWQDFLATATRLACAAVPLAGSASRIAAVQEGFLEQMDTPTLDHIAARLMNVPHGWSGAPFEWDWRQARLVTRAFGGGEHPTNTLATVKRVGGRFLNGGDSFDRIRIDLDVNTSPDDREARFDAAAVGDFFGQAVAWHDELGRQVVPFVRGNP